MLWLLSSSIYVGKYQLSEFSLGGSDERNSKEINGSEGSQIGSFILFVYHSKTLNFFTSIVLSVTTQLGKMYLSIGINSI